MPSSATDDSHLDDFRIADASEIGLLIDRLLHSRTPLHLSTVEGTLLTATLWACDPAKQLLTLAVDAGAAALPPVIDGPQVRAIAYLDQIKLQFELCRPVLLRGAERCMLNGELPREVFRFQRRNAFRVRPLLRQAPQALLRHPALPDMALALRILDVSLTGCALFLPGDVPPLEPGVLMNGVTIELDADTRFGTSLRLHHISAFNQDSGGSRLGCELVRPNSGTERLLQCYIDQTQKRRRLMALE